MTLKIRGKVAAFKVLALMDEVGGGGVEMGRAAEVISTWWVHGPGLDAREEQQVLERLPPGCLVKVEEATYRELEVVTAPVPKGMQKGPIRRRIMQREKGSQ